MQIYLAIVAERDHLTLPDFKDWINGSIEDYSNDDDWQEIVKEFEIDLEFIKANSKQVFGSMFMQM